MRLLSLSEVSIQKRTSPGKWGIRDFEISFAISPVLAFEISGQRAVSPVHVEQRGGERILVGDAFAAVGRRHEVVVVARGERAEDTDPVRRAVSVGEDLEGDAAAGHRALSEGARDGRRDRPDADA